jgi:hypothetical protein
MVLDIWFTIQEGSCSVGTLIHSESWVLFWKFLLLIVTGFICKLPWQQDYHMLWEWTGEILGCHNLSGKLLHHNTFQSSMELTRSLYITMRIDHVFRLQLDSSLQIICMLLSVRDLFVFLMYPPRSHPVWGRFYHTLTSWEVY